MSPRPASCDHLAAARHMATSAASNLSVALAFSGTSDRRRAAALDDAAAALEAALAAVRQLRGTTIPHLESVERAA